MKLEDIPKAVLSHTGCAVCGFLIALWCQETTLAKQNQPKFKAGFIITVKAGKEPSSDRSLENTDNLAIISRQSSEACRLTCEGSLIRRRGRFIQIIGDIENLNAAVKISEEIHEGRVETTTLQAARDLAACHELPLVIYGSHP